MRKLLTALLISIAALAALGQKPASDELGFKPERLYDFSNTDSVSLFNGNLIVTIPIGRRYTVSSNLSYQLSLVFNGKAQDVETWCEDPDNTGCTGTKLKQAIHPNLRSNAGNGWRVSLGRLLPPYDTTRYNDNLITTKWVYEGPSGDEHMLDDVLAGMRMRVVNNETREVEFGSGEIHRFQQTCQYDWRSAGITCDNVWRLRQMRDRFGNAVNISYTVDDENRDLTWTIHDTAYGSRYQTVTFANYPVMSDGYSKGQMVTSIDTQAFNGNRAVYTFGYTPNLYTNLTSLTLPDSTQYAFTGQQTLDEIKYPTGGKVDYTYDYYYIAAQDSLCTSSMTLGVTSRTILDGATSRRWDYVQTGSGLVPGTAGPADPCGTNDNRTSGPGYWSRTSVIAPRDTTNHRSRTDHYFDTFSDSLASPMTFQITTPLPGQGVQKFGHTGTVGAPIPAARSQLIMTNSDGDHDASDDPTHPDTLRLLSTEVYDNCDSTGDCSGAAARLLRTTYDRYVGDAFPAPYPPGSGSPSDTARLVSARTVFAGDTGCGGNPCYTQTTYSDDNGAAQFRTTTIASNFPGSNPVTTTTQYPTWSTSDLTDFGRAWILNTYSETSRTEGSVTAREQFCFDASNDDDHATGALLTHRTLAGAATGTTDIVKVFTYSGGNPDTISEYGADVQPLSYTGDNLCSMPSLSGTTPWYKSKHTFSYGILSRTQHYDRTTQEALSFFDLDRDIDPWTGVVTAVRDTAAVTTSYGYDSKTRLASMTNPNGTVTNYTYTLASGTVGGSWSPAYVDEVATGATDTLRNRYSFDGLGRLVLSSHQGPDNLWVATQTALDEQARKLTESTPQAAGFSAPSWPISTLHVTSYKYDALNRVTLLTAPDNQQTAFTYTGVREKKKTVAIATDPTKPCTTGTNTLVSTKETYDAQGRLTAVTEAADTACAVTTYYSYDVNGKLTSVTSSAGTQARYFTYDLRGFMTQEQHPELGITGNGTIRYRNYDPRGYAGRKTTGADNTLLDLFMTFDSAGRLTAVDDRGATRRPLKRYIFAESNDTSTSPIDYRNGKLLTAVRYNHPTIGDVTVTESYKYANALGRPSQRDTLIQAGTATLESFSHSFNYDQFGALAKLDYPTCLAAAPCGTNLPGSVTLNRTHGYLTSIPSYAASITYNPDSFVYQVVHNTTTQITDTYDPDVTGMSRPASIEFTGFPTCNPPTATVSGSCTILPGGSAQIQATLTGTSPWFVTWADGYTQNSSTNVVTRIVHPSTTTDYSVLSVSDAYCTGTGTGTATVTVALPAPTGFVATTQSNSLYVLLTWNSVSGATWYEVERATTLNGTYSTIGRFTTTQYTEQFGSSSPITYVYRVRAGATINGLDTKSSPSTIDYATVATTLFSTDPLTVSVTPVTGAQLGEFRQAIDAVRAAAGLTPAWSSYGAPTGPVTAADNTTARQKLDEAASILLGHGISYSGETPVAGGVPRAYQWQQIRDGVK